jgi:membrane protease YdiL (CAAX protease family)
VLFALEFTFINSLLEELFWRVFLYREIGNLFKEVRAFLARTMPSHTLDRVDWTEQ